MPGITRTSLKQQAGGLSNILTIKKAILTCSVASSTFCFESRMNKTESSAYYLVHIVLRFVCKRQTKKISVQKCRMETIYSLEQYQLKIYFLWSLFFIRFTYDSTYIFKKTYFMVHRHFFLKKKNLSVNNISLP